MLDGNDGSNVVTTGYQRGVCNGNEKNTPQKIAGCMFEKKIIFYFF